MGFFVLLGFVVYVVLAMFVVNVIEKYSGSKIAKYAAIAMFVLIPTWDIVPGQLYFNYLCEKEAGIKVVKTVEVDRTYFLPDGKPDLKKLAALYDQPDKYDRGFSPTFHIAKSESVVQDRQTGETLGVAIDFAHKGGWLNVYIFPQKSSQTCPTYPNFSIHSAVWQKVIRPKPTSGRGGN